MICARIETSSAETGSSSTMSRAEVAIARGMDIWCRWPATELVREAARVSRLQPDHLQRFGDAAADRLARELAADLEWLADDGANPHPRAQGAVRILKDRLHRLAVHK